MLNPPLPDAQPTGSPEENTPLPPGRISTGIQWLDVILSGGLPEERVYLILGEPGTGKTTLSLQFLVEAVRNGDPALLVTLAETPNELLTVAESHGIDLSGVTIHEANPSESGLGDLGDDLESPDPDLPERDYTALHPEEIELGQSLRNIVDVVRRIRPKRVVIDSLTGIRLLAREPVRYRRQILALKNFFMRSGCTVYFIDDPASRAGAESQLETICHGVMRLERLAPEYGRERRRMQVVKMRGVNFHGGYHDYSIQRGGLVIWPRLVAAHHRRPYSMTAIPSGIAEVDSLLGGGPDRGTTLLAIGPSGVGKSSLCQQYCRAAAERGEYFAWFSFDERLDTLYSRAKSMGFNLREMVEAGKCSVEQIDPGSISPGEFIQKVRRQVENFGANTIVIDSLNGYMNAMPGEKFLIIQMHELLTYLSHMGVLSMIVIAQHGLLGTHLDPPVDLSYLCDTVVVLRYFESAGQVRRAISVMKKRGAAHESTIRELRVTDQGVRVGEPLRDFQGVLTGAPIYVGREGPLMKTGPDAPPPHR